MDYGPSHQHSMHTAGGAASVAAAQPQIETARGGDRTGFEGFNRCEASTGQDRPVDTSIGPPQHVCEERSLGDLCYVPSCLIR